MRFLLALLMFALFWPVLRGLGRLFGGGGSPAGARSARREAASDHDGPSGTGPRTGPKSGRNGRKSSPDVIDVTYEDVP